MADVTFNTKEKQTIDRELLLLFLNTGEAAQPVWSPVGKRVSDSSMEYDWSEESYTDILGDNYTDLSKPKITQNFDPWNLAAGDPAQLKLWKDSIKNHDTNAMANNDMLIVHAYAGSAENAFFAERYSSCTVKPNSLGGAGGGKLAMPVNVAYGGTRTLGTAALADGTVTFTPEAA